MRKYRGLMLLAAVTAVLASSYMAASAASGRYQAMRDKMVTTQIEWRGVTDPKVLAAMRRVPRHKFVPADEVDAAYADHPLSIGFGQTISQPYIVAYMCELAQLKPGDRVLEVGTGSGYHAAVIAQIVKRVYTIEIVPQLAERARKTTKTLGYTNIELRQGDGYFGWKQAAPFDAIIVTAAAEHIPPPLAEQLAEGGRIIIPLGHPFFTQKLVLAEKKDGKLHSKGMLAVRFVPLTGKH